MVFLKSIKRNLLVISLMYLLVGYSLITTQGNNNSLVFMIFSVGLGLAGVFSIVGYLLTEISLRYKRNEFVYGALLLIIGVFLYSEFVLNNSSADLKLIIGMAMGMSAIIKVQDLFDSKAIGKKVVGTYFGLAVICVVLSLFISQNILIPSSIAYYVYGISMIFAGISDIISNFYLAASRSSYEALIKKQEETEKILTEAEKDINTEESKPISFVEKVLYEPEEETSGSINIELSEEEKNK